MGCPNQDNTKALVHGRGLLSVSETGLGLSGDLQELFDAKMVPLKAGEAYSLVYGIAVAPLSLVATAE